MGVGFVECENVASILHPQLVRIHIYIVLTFYGTFVTVWYKSYIQATAAIGKDDDFGYGV